MADDELIYCAVEDAEFPASEFLVDKTLHVGSVTSGKTSVTLGHDISGGEWKFDAHLKDAKWSLTKEPTSVDQVDTVLYLQTLKNLRRH